MSPQKRWATRDSFVPGCLGRRWTYGSGFVLAQRSEHVGDFIEGFEFMESLSTTTDFPNSLGTSEDEDTDNGSYSIVESHRFGEELAVFGDATVVTDDPACVALVHQLLEGTLDRRFLERHDGIAIGLLVARVGQRVDRERIVLGCGHFLFDQGTDDAGFDLCEDWIHIGNHRTHGEGRAKRTA